MRMPGWVEPMLATLTDQRDLPADWLYERKLDGIRALAFVTDDGARLLSRNRLELAGYPEVASALRARAAPDVILDGEVVGYVGRRTGFEVLQQRHHLPRRGRGALRIEYSVFDIMWAAGEDLRPLPLLERKRILRKALRPGGALRLSAYRRGDATMLLDAACGRGWEGLIAKRPDAPYAKGRSRDWLKLKCSLEQEFVVGGFTDPKGSRQGLGALLLGYHEDGGLRYAGEVGTGFDHRTLLELRARLGGLEVEESPYVDLSRRPKGVHFVEPRLVVQVAFSEWTRDGRLRHPRFLGERTDKSPGEIVRERPA